MAPRTNRIFYDEQIYQNIGQNLADSRRAQMCNDGAVDDGRLQCSSGEYNKQPYAYPHLLSLAYRVFGVGTAPAFVVNAVAMGLSVCFVYLLVAILFSDRVAAFFAALLLALTPQQLVWSATAAVEPSASVACLAALLAAACFVRLRSTVSLVGRRSRRRTRSSFDRSRCLIVPVIALLIWQRAPEEFARPRLWWAGLLFLALAAVHRGAHGGGEERRLGHDAGPHVAGLCRDNLRVNGWFYLADARFPAVYTLLALAGLSGRRAETGRLTLTCYFLLFFGIALLFYAGSYDYGADVRYSLATYPPLAMLGGLGLARLAGWSIERARTARGACLRAGARAQFLWYLPADPIDGRRRVGRSRGRAVRAIARARPAAGRLRPDAESRDVSGVGRQRRPDVAGRRNPARLRDLARRYPAASICTGTSGATSRIRFSGILHENSRAGAQPSGAGTAGTGPAIRAVPIASVRVRAVKSVFILLHGRHSLDLRTEAMR